MPTQAYVINPSDGYVEVAGAEDDFIVENTGGGACKLTLQAAAPAADAPHHWLSGGEAFVRIGTGACYVSASYQTATVTVTK